MSEEVINLSSEMSSGEDENECSQPTTSNKTIHNETNARKRKTTLNNSNDKAKVMKLEVNKISILPQPECSKDLIGTERKVIRPQLIVKTKIPIPSAKEDVFKNFIKICLQKRNDEDTKKGLQKLEKLYSKLSPFDQSSDELRLYINNCSEQIIQGLSKDIYTPMLDLHTEMKNLIKTNLVEQAENNTEGSVHEIQVSKEDMKKIKLLEKSIEKCLQKIKDLEQKEVDFDQEQDSAYLQEDKYKKRLIQLYNALSKITGDKVIRKQIQKKKIKRKDISDEMTGISSVDEAILSFVNMDIDKINKFKYLETQRCADHIKMPEYLDILKCIQQCNLENNLDLSKEKMRKLAKKSFQAVGNFLKKKRMDETKLYMHSLLVDGEEDPAVKDATLNEKLQKNKKEGDKKLEDIFKKYVDKQEGLHVEEKSEDTCKDDSEMDTENEDLDDNMSAEEEENEEEKQTEAEKNEEKTTEEKSEETKNEEKKQNDAEKNEEKKQNEEKKNEEKKTEEKKNEEEKQNETEKNEEKNEKKQNTAEGNDKKLESSTTKENSIVNEDDKEDKTSKKVVDDDDILVLDDDSDDNVLDVVESNRISSTESKQGAQSKSSNKPSFIKVRSFAKASPAWSDTSPKKKIAKSNTPTPQALRDLLKPECVDLTQEKQPKQPPSAKLPTITARSINPLSKVAKHVIPANRVVIVKNVINYNVNKSGWLSKDKGTDKK